MKEQLIQIIQQIPPGKVTSYGEVAQQLDIQCGVVTSGWMVGKVLSGFAQKEQDEYPWQRVITKEGYVSALKLGERWLVQIGLLRQEDVEVKDGFVDMKKYGWYFR